MCFGVNFENEVFYFCLLRENNHFFHRKLFGVGVQIKSFYLTRSILLALFYYANGVTTTKSLHSFRSPLATRLDYLFLPVYLVISTVKIQTDNLGTLRYLNRPTSVITALNYSILIKILPIFFCRC